MKKIAATLCLVLIVTFLFGCETYKVPDSNSTLSGDSSGSADVDTPTGDSSGSADVDTPTGDSSDNANEDTLGPEPIRYKIVCSKEYNGSGTMDIFYALGVKDGVELTLGADTSAPAEREIVIGRTNREISTVAYGLIPKWDGDKEDEIMLPYEDFEGDAHGITIDGANNATVSVEAGNKYYSKPGGTTDYIYIPKNTYSPDGADVTVVEMKLRINQTADREGSINIIYGRWDGMPKFIISNPDGDTLSISDWRDGATTTLSAQIGAKLGEWFTLRIENYTNSSGETVSGVYVNGKHIGDSTNAGILSSANLDNLVVRTNSNIFGSVDFDDVYFGNDKMIADKKVKEGGAYSGFAIYSDGNSVAIAYDEDSFNIGAAEESAINYFIDNYITGKDTFTLEKGVMAKELIDLVAYQRVIDEQDRERTYGSIRSTVINYTGDAALAEDIVDAFREYYALTTPDIVSWLANLYDPGIGGFYYSNSARDNVGFLPDLESSAQAMMIIHYSGLVDHIGGQTGLPEWFRTQLGNFAKSLQNPNGFFYHPQWNKEATDRNQERRSRDTSWALGLIGLAGMKPTYDIYDTAGDRTLVDGTKVDAQGNVIPASSEALTEKLGGRSVAALVSKVISTAQTYISPELLTEEAFYAWIDGGCGYKIRNGSYGWGSFVCSRTQEYLQRDKQLAAENADWRCGDVLIEYLNANQNPANGTWHWGDKSNERYYYECVNGLLKIGGTYTSFGVEMPYALEACQTAIEAIYSDTEPIHICDVYNPWFAVSNTLKNLSACAANEAEGKAKVSEVRRELLADAPNAIRGTLEKRSLFKKEDGSFSYFPKSSSQWSTGMIVALKDVNEGDVNASVIAAVDIRDRMCNALGLPTVDILGPADYIKFISILE